jgi:hypothetical protein
MNGELSSAWSRTWQEVWLPLASSLLKNSISPQSDSVTDSFGFRFVHAFDARRRSFSADC